MLPRLLIVWVCVIIGDSIVSADETKMYLNYLLSDHQRSHPGNGFLIPPPIRPRLPLHMIHPMYSPLHHACDQFTAIENSMLKSNYPHGLVHGLLLPPKLQPGKEEKKKIEVLKEKWTKAKFMLKGKLGYALNNNEPYYPLDPTANLKTSAKNENKKGVIVLRDKLGLQVFSNHPVTVVGSDGEPQELQPGIEKPPSGESDGSDDEDDDYDTTPNDIYRPGTNSHRPEIPTIPYGMPSTGPFSTDPLVEKGSSPVSSEHPHQGSSELPSLQSTASDPSTELQPLSPATSHPLPPHHHYSSPVTVPEQEMQTHDPGHSGSEEMRQESRTNDRRQHEQQPHIRTAAAFDSVAERRLIIHRKPPDSIFLNLPRVAPFARTVNSTGRRSESSGTPVLISGDNQDWKPVTRDPVRRGSPKITFEAQTDDPLTATTVDQEVAGDTSNQVSRHVQPPRPLPSVHGTTESQRQTATTMRTTAALSTASSIILASSASYFSSLNSSLSDRSDVKGQ